MKLFGTAFVGESFTIYVLYYNVRLSYRIKVINQSPGVTLIDINLAASASTWKVKKFHSESHERGNLEGII